LLRFSESDSLLLYTFCLVHALKLLLLRVGQSVSVCLLIVSLIWVAAYSNVNNKNTLHDVVIGPTT